MVAGQRHRYSAEALKSVILFYEDKNARIMDEFKTPAAISRLACRIFGFGENDEVADFGVPQHRKRVIILGVNKAYFQNSSICHEIIDEFYNVIMPHMREASKQRTVRDAIGDLPSFMPSKDVVHKDGNKYSHIPIDGCGVPNHIPRFHNERDQKIFRMLSEDIEKGQNKYVSTEALKALYTKMTGKKSNIHKYYVLRWDEPSNTIPAHLYKDGMRHIHPDSKQARSITVREAARLQTFADDFVFLGPTMAQYKMIIT